MASRDRAPPGPDPRARVDGKARGRGRLRFDAYPKDLAGRAQAFQKLVAGGVTVTEALATAGLLADDAA